MRRRVVSAGTRSDVCLVDVMVVAGIKVLTGAGCGNYLLPVQTFVLLFVVCRADEVAHGSRG